MQNGFEYALTIPIIKKINEPLFELLIIIVTFIFVIHFFINKLFVL